MNRPFDLTETDFKAIAALVYDKTGIVLAEHKRNMVYSRLSRRLRELNLPSFTAYIDYLREPNRGDELGQLVNAITTNLTSFFREPHHFEHLKHQVLLPLLSSNSSSKRLRIWSAGCSSGAEPYSIAMVLASCLDKTRGWDAKILATDIDTNMLNRGANGIYTAKDYSAIPTDYQRFCKLDGEQLCMSSKLKELIAFRRLNLLEEWPMKGPFDVIFCRNVVIYFDKETQTRLFARYHELLKTEGYLYIGHSENLFKVSNQFRLEGKTIYRPV